MTLVITTGFQKSCDVEYATVLEQDGHDDSFHREISNMSLSCKLFYKIIL